jgi:hypothetical protein
VGPCNTLQQAGMRCCARRQPIDPPASRQDNARHNTPDPGIGAMLRPGVRHSPPRRDVATSRRSLDLSSSPGCTNTTVGPKPSPRTLERDASGASKPATTAARLALQGVNPVGPGAAPEGAAPTPMRFPTSNARIPGRLRRVDPKRSERRTHNTPASRRLVRRQRRSPFVLGAEP